MNKKNRKKITLKEEAQRATKLLSGKIVKVVWRHREKELGIEFTDGTRLFVDHQPECVEISIIRLNYPSSTNTSIF